MTGKKTLTILKIGGRLVEDEALLADILSRFVLSEGLKILVHGGGKMTSELCQKLGIPPKMAEGRRITDADTLKIATMVYAGQANKNIVGKLQALGCGALGLSGADLDSIRAHKRPVANIDFGFAGDIDHINTPIIRRLLDAQITPVFCAITHDGNGQLLNTNADTIAATLAAELAPFYDVALKFCFEKPGVLRDPEDEGSVIPSITPPVCADYRRQGIISEGMIPKLDNAFYALRKGVAEVRICGPEGILCASKGTKLCL
ncbi:MAG: acetylglutamate kinase [Bacteroidetes bacterium]|nr:MAG: acetylglutamate kinase [Bacteroidota bacterium]